MNSAKERVAVRDIHAGRIAPMAFADTESNCPERRCAVDASLSELESHIANATCAAKALYERLAPVMHDVPPAVASGESKTQHVSCALAQQIDALARHVRDLTDLLRETRDRLEI